MISNTGRFLLCVAVGAGLAIATSVRAQGAAQGHDHGGEHFGSVHLDTSCSAAVQPQFDRAVAMLHSFFYPETDKAFQAIADREPSCAMAYWGVAISTRPNPLTAPFAPALLKRGFDAIQRARAAAPKTARERDWIDALAQFFDGHDTVDQLTRTRRYAAAMEALHARYPNDSEIAVFYALSLLEAVDLTDTAYRGQLKAAALLERLQRRQPDHPGIVHYLIHSYDYAPIAAKGLPAARRYATLAPSAPHALHMPSHIFSTLGMWPDAIQTNLVADRANIAYAETTNPKAAANTATIITRYHALDFLTYAYLQLAQDRRAKAILDQRNMIAVMSSEERITAHTAYAAIPVRYALERGAWKEAATLAPIRTPFKEAEAIVWFGRVVGAARGDDRAAATRDLAELSRLRQELTAPGADPYWAEQVAILEKAAGAWVALGESRTEDAVAAMQEAANREDRTEKHVAMENRLWPMRELLGELLIETGRPREALREFERSMRVVPNRFRSLAGAARAASDAGNRRLALTYYRKLLTQAANAEGDRPELETARRFVASR